MSYSKLYCPECNGVSKCIGYRFGDGVSKEIPHGFHHIYFYECENGHKFEYDYVWDKDKFVIVREEQTQNES